MERGKFGFDGIQPPSLPTITYGRSERQKTFAQSPQALQLSTTEQMAFLSIPLKPDLVAGLHTLRAAS